MSGKLAVPSGLRHVAQNVSGAIQKASVAISAGFRSCDDVLDKDDLDTELTVSEIQNKPVNATKIWGTYQFNLDVTCGGEGSETAVDFGSLITLKPSYKEVSKKFIPVKVRWKRKCGGVVVLALINNETTLQFPITADDVGCSILAEVTPLEENLGTAFVEVGPFSVDGAMREAIQNYLVSNGTSFSVRGINIRTIKDANIKESKTLNNFFEEDQEDEEYVLSITSEEVQLMKPGPGNIGFTRRWSSKMHTALVSVVMGNPCAFELHFKENGNIENVKVAALSRRQRDIIVLIIRAFQAQKLMQTSLLLEQVAKNTHAKKSMSQDNTSFGLKTTELDFFFIYEQFNRQLSDALKSTRKAAQEKNRAVAQRDALEKDIDATIEVYKKLLVVNPSGLQIDTADVTQRAVLIGDLQTQVKEGQSQSRQYLEELERLRRDYRILKEKYDEKEEQLRAWLYSSTTGNATNSKFDRLKELEGPLKAIEKMNLTTMSNDKQLVDTITVLNTKVEDLERQKYEVEQNFSYMKKKHDELARRQRHSAVSQVELSGTVERLEKASKKEIEAYELKIKDLETMVTNYNTKLENATAQNLRMKTQNETLQKTLDTHSKTNGCSTTQLIDLNKTLLIEGTQADYKSVILAANESIKKLESSDKKITFLERENLELKNKIRQLALQD